MIARYTLPEMGAIWSEQAKYDAWLKVEVAACEAWAKLGRIPAKDLAVIKKKAKFSLKRIEKIERKTNHDLIAFTTSVAEFVGPSSRFIHMGLTSTDVVDTAQAIQLTASCDLLLKQLGELRSVLRRQAKTHRYSMMIGRTHGVHAEPVTFGLKMALWYDEVGRQIERLKQAREHVAVGKISGAVGTFANIDPRIEQHVCKRLGLKSAPVSTQTLQRDRHAYFLSVLAVIASSLEKFATEIRNLQRTEILEAEEYFAVGQKGSSAMPHKRNPLTAERVAGLARVMRGYAVAAQENVALWHERDITHSSAERIILPDSTILLNYMLSKFIGVMEKLNVYPERMKRNIQLTRGLVSSQQVLLALVKRGLTRERAYAIVQRNALNAWQNEANFRQLIEADSEVTNVLTPSEIEECFNLSYHMKNVDYLLKRAGIS
ncbi:MAG TPA: adenylosuccinate lyase [bacterium]|nr:adenylosuccinate lyase [bacterium]